MIFEVGKTYIHNSGTKMKIIGKLDTITYGHGIMIGEDLFTGELVPVGDKEENAVNWMIFDDSRKEESIGDLDFIIRGLSHLKSNIHDDGIAYNVTLFQLDLEALRGAIKVLSDLSKERRGVNVKETL